MTTQWYDDGRSDVLGGLIGPVERVIVIGAGIAGLTVANGMRHGGVDCTVLEARDRIGGRLHTRDVAGWPVDLGGSWIHTPVGNPLRRFAEQMGVPCRPSNPLSTLSIHDASEGRLLTPDEVAAATMLQLDAFADGVESQLRSQLGPQASSADAIEAFVAAADLSAAEVRRARQFLHAMVEADAAGPADGQALQWLWTEDDYDGDFFGDTPVGGYRSLVAAFAAGLDVHLGQAVVSIEVGDDGVEVRTEDGSTLRASHVVVAVPLGCLKGGVPAFVPPLPADRQSRVDRLGFGRYEKVTLAFESAFWRDAGMSHLVLLPADPTHAAQWIFDLDAFGAGPVLSCHFFHSAAERLARSHQAAVHDLKASLATAYGVACPEPVEVHVTSWADDPWTRGAYTHIPIGAEPADLDRLGEPIGGRLLFAGEHTQHARIGYADGAMTSGVREAKRLLRQPAVLLG